MSIINATYCLQLLIQNSKFRRHHMLWHHSLCKYSTPSLGFPKISNSKSLFAATMGTIFAYYIFKSNSNSMSFSNCVQNILHNICAHCIRSNNYSSYSMGDGYPPTMIHHLVLCKSPAILKKWSANTQHSLDCLLLATGSNIQRNTYSTNTCKDGVPASYSKIHNCFWIVYEGRQTWTCHYNPKG